VPYTLVQTGFEAPSVEQLKSAFQAVPGFTAFDALTIGRDVFGILMRGVELETASTMKNAFAEQHFETEVVDEAQLPQPPDPFQVHQLDCRDDALVIFDSIGRENPVPWEDISLVAAGNTGMVEFREVWTERIVQAITPHVGAPKIVVDHDLKEEHPERWLLEIIAGKDRRYSVNSAKCSPLLFRSVGGSQAQGFDWNFGRLVRLILERAKNAASNRGAESLREAGGAVFRYAGKTSFYDEMIWILWKMGWRAAA